MRENISLHVAFRIIFVPDGLQPRLYASFGDLALVGEDVLPRTVFVTMLVDMLFQLPRSGFVLDLQRYGKIRQAIRPSSHQQSGMSLAPFDA